MPTATVRESAAKPPRAPLLLAGRIAGLVDVTARPPVTFDGAPDVRVERGEAKDLSDKSTICTLADFGRDPSEFRRQQNKA
jgi:hypothetical protein